MPITPAVHDGITVWTGANGAELDPTQIGTIVGVSNLAMLYDSRLGAAALVTGGLVFTARQAGPAGHDITVTVVNHGAPNSPLSVTVNGRNVVIALATNQAGEATSTAAQVAAAVNAYPQALISVSTAGDGSDVAGTIAPTALSPATVETGAYASSYDTLFGNSARDALVSYLAGPSINATELFLYVRGVSETPAFYVYDLLANGYAWNGLENLDLTGFWSGSTTGAITNLKIVGVLSPSVPVPEGPSIALLGIGLILLAWSRKNGR